MEVYRLANTSYIPLDGKGGLYGAGRWHSMGNLVTYAVSSRALAVLERFIHDADTLSVPNLQMLTIHIPDHMSFDQRFEKDLPKGWDTTENGQQQVSQSIGTAFLKKLAHPYLKVPSAIVSHEYNYILNPLHPDANEIKVISTCSYQYDPRYKKMIRE